MGRREAEVDVPGFWTKVAAPEGYNGDCYAWGNYLAASIEDGLYCCTWHLLRQSSDGWFREVPGSRPFVQTFAVRPRDASDVDRMLQWALSEIKKHRSRRREPESNIEDFPLG